MILQGFIQVSPRNVFSNSSTNGHVLEHASGDILCAVLMKNYTAINSSSPANPHRTAVLSLANIPQHSTQLLPATIRLTVFVARGRITRLPHTFQISSWQGSNFSLIFLYIINPSATIRKLQPDKAAAFPQTAIQ